jgi:hypothetical protein
MKVLAVSHRRRLTPEVTLDAITAEVAAEPKALSAPAGAAK